MTPEQIVRFNAAIRGRAPEAGFEGPLSNTLQPLDLPAAMPGDSLRARLEHNRDQLYTPEPMYDSREYFDNRLLVYSERMKDELAAKMNITRDPENHHPALRPCGEPHQCAAISHRRSGLLRNRFCDGPLPDHRPQYRISGRDPARIIRWRLPLRRNPAGAGLGFRFRHRTRRARRGP